MNAFFTAIMAMLVFFCAVMVVVRLCEVEPEHRPHRTVLTNCHPAPDQGSNAMECTWLSGPPVKPWAPQDP